MKGLGTIYRKELSAMFNTAVAYIVIAAILGLASFVYCLFYLFNVKVAETRPYFDAFMPFFLSLLLPAITMRIWSEEFRQGTIELLMTLPAKLSTVVLGKYLACVTFYLVILAGSLFVPAVLVFVWGAEIAPILSGYLGIALCGCVILAAGIYISAHTKDQIVAFILALLLCVVWTSVGFHWATDWIDSSLPGLGTFIRDQIGLSSHLESFAKGLVDFSDLIFFLSFSAMFVGLTIFTLAGRTNVREGDRLVFASFFLLGIGVFAALNANEARLGRLDVTEAKIYTVSPASVRILSRLRAPVTINYYVSPNEKMPPRLKQLERDVSDLLRELSLTSSKINYKVLDPKSDEKTENALKEKGIEPIPTGSQDQEQAQFALVFSAMTISYLNKSEEIIRWVGPDELPNLEFEIVSRINRLSLERKPKVAVVSKVEEMNPYMRMMGQMPRDEFQTAAGLMREQGYDVARIGLSAAEPIPPDADALVVFQPENLNDRQLYEINRFVRSGHPAIIAVQRYTMNYRNVTRAGIGVTSAAPAKIEPLLQAWGVEVPEKILLDRNFLPLRRGIEEFPLPVHVQVTQETMSKDVGVMNGVDNLLYMWGSPVTVSEKPGLKSKILATSSQYSWLVPSTNSVVFFDDLRAERDKWDGKQNLFVMLEGTFPDAFDGKPVPKWPEGPEGETKASTVTGPSKVVVCGCAKMFSEAFLQFHGNSTLLMNMLDVLTHGEDLAQIRSKTYKPKTLGELSPTQMFFYRYVLMISAAPILVLLAGLIRLIVRRSAREAYQRTYARV